MNRFEMMRELKARGASYSKSNTNEELLAILLDSYKSETADAPNIPADEQQDNSSENEIIEDSNGLVSTANNTTDDNAAVPLNSSIQLKDKIITNPYDLKQFSFYEKKVYNDRVEIWKNDGTYIRTYSRQAHGAKYAELADEFLYGRMLRLKGKMLGDY